MDSLEAINVFEFAARMWNGTSAMIVLQEMELGYQIEISGKELAQIARFKEQSRFSADDVPELTKEWIVDDVDQQLYLALEELQTLVDE